MGDLLLCAAAIWEAIDVVWKGMLGIFVITAIMILCVFLLGKIPNRKK